MKFSYKNWILKRIFKKGILYVDSQNFLQFSQKEKKYNASLLFLAKDTCFETIKEFPFSSVKDIKNAISSDIDEYSPFTTDLFFVRKIKETEGKTKVNIWFVKQNIADSIDQLSPMIVLPETFVFAFIRKMYPLFLKIEKQDEKDLFIHVGHDLAIKSMESNINKKGFETFLRICGSSSDIEQENIFVYKNEKDIKQVLKTVFLNIPFTELLKFVNKKSYSFEILGKTGFKYLCIVCALLFFYSTICLFLPYQKKKELMAEDQILSKKAGDLIGKRDDLGKKLAQLNRFKNLVEEYQPKTSLIQTLIKTVPQNSLIKRLNVSGQVVEIEGIASDASAFIESLGKNKDIFDPHFISPVRKDKKTNMEIFKLNFKYIPLQNREIDG